MPPETTIEEAPVAQDAPEQEENTQSVADLSTEQLEAFLAGGSPTTEEPVATEQAEKGDEGVEGEPGEPAEAPLNKQRIRPRAAEDQQVIDLYKSEGFDGTFQKAVDVIYGKSGPVAESMDGGEPSADPALDGTIVDLREEIQKLETDIDDANEEMETSKAMKLQRELQRKETDILRLELQRETVVRRQEDDQQATYRQRAVESRDRAVQTIPALNDESSVTRKQFDAYVVERQNDPDYAPVFNSPKWPELLAREFAATHQLTPAQQAEPVRVVSQNPPTGTQTKVLTSADAPASNQTNQKLSAETILDNLDKVSKDALYGLLGG